MRSNIKYYADDEREHRTMAMDDISIVLSSASAIIKLKEITFKMNVMNNFTISKKKREKVFPFFCLRVAAAASNLVPFIFGSSCPFRIYTAFEFKKLYSEWPNTR